MSKDIQLCGICAMPIVPPVGPPDSPILLVGSYPGPEEIKKGVPWVGKGGKIFKKELQLAGINYGGCRVTNLWLHPKSKSTEEKDWHLDRLREELEGKKFVLLMGADVCKLFTDGGKVSDYESTKIRSALLPKSVKSAWIMRNPANAALKGSCIGPIKDVLKKFAKEALKESWI